MRFNNIVYNVHHIWTINIDLWMQTYLSNVLSCQGTWQVLFVGEY